MVRPGLSDALQAFLAEAPHAREPHIEFLDRAGQSLTMQSLVLDVGSGDAPYRELFSHTNYITCDWEHSIYKTPPDIVAHADVLPVGSGRLDVVLCSQVLEHVPEPWVVIDEFYRVLRPGGSVWLTAPMVWYLHEEPYDYYRYTSHGLRYLLQRSGFVDIDVVPMNPSFSTFSQLISHLGWMMGRNEDGYDTQREIVSRTMTELAPLIEAFANFDTRWILPLNYAAVARHP